MAFRMKRSELQDFDMMLKIGGEHDWHQPIALPEHQIAHLSGPGGNVRFAGSSMPGITLANICWDTTSQVELWDDKPSPHININFMLSGNMYTRFNSLYHDLDMQPGRHNMVYVPESGDKHQIRGGELLDMFHISVEQDLFVSLIGEGHVWCDAAVRELEAGRPFSGIHGTGDITPGMRQIIDVMRRLPPQGPLRNLIQQSRLMELLSMQLNQFMEAAAPPRPEGLSEEDTDRLMLLKAYLNAHFLESLSLSGLSRVCLLNEFKLKKGFKQLYGTTVFGYLKALRMEHAAQLLRDHRMQVAEVADILGYEHAHHFASAFKKHFGQRPSDHKSLPSHT